VAAAAAAAAVVSSSSRGSQLGEFFPRGISEFQEELGPHIGRLKLLEYILTLVDLSKVIPARPKCQRCTDDKSHNGDDLHGQFYKQV